MVMKNRQLPLQIKVCGLCSAHNIKEVSNLSVDMIGFVFSPESSRFIRLQPSGAGLLPDYAKPHHDILLKQTSQALQPPKRVGVFTNAMPQQIITYIYNYQLDYVQLDGSASPVLIDNLRRSVDPDIRPNIKFIKTIYVADKADLSCCQQYEGHADMLLFDAKHNQATDADEPFDWNILYAYSGKLPFLLGGGIGPNEVATIRQFDHPQCVGINLNSKFEKSPTIKDIHLLQKVLEAIRQDNI